MRLETTRLVLRELTPVDAPALLPIWGDAITMRYYPRALKAPEVEEWLARQIARYPGGTGLLAMELRETGAMVGDCGPVWQEVDGAQELEIGYHVRRDFQNQGLATEAARAVRAYAFGALGCEHVISLIRPENGASRRVAEKNGFRMDRVVFWRGYDHCVYRSDRDDGEGKAAR
ncbi:MAG TPA: GNAT family N-acetyltransferase [Acidobacteriaceae bacterium]|nr:GNAT family N-acetyltransferase [Acidobacteriaceae bacterium]